MRIEITTQKIKISARAGAGDQTMNKQTMLGALIGLLMLTLSTAAFAAAVPSNNQDSVQITITPNVDRGVEIDSQTVSVDLGTVDLQTTTQTVRPATVTILGTLASQELQVDGAILPDWSFDTSPTVDTTSMEQDALAFFLLFSDTTLSGPPTASEFLNDSGAFTGSTARAGGEPGNGVFHEKTAGGAKDMDNRPPTDQSHLWFFLRLPGTTTTSNEQTVTITLTAVDAS
jgi:type 1 fimbria pilin